MTTIVPLEAWAFSREYEKRVKIWIKRALPVLLEELKSLTPEDTREMLNSYRIEALTDSWWKIVWTITNDADYAIYVEYWSEWVMFWYHKPKWSLFYIWHWNRTFARAVDNSREKIIEIIYNEVNR